MIRLFGFGNPMASMTLIIDLVRVIHEVPFFDKPLDALIHHRARDAVLEDCLFDWLLSKTILISWFESRTNVEGNRLVASRL